MTKGQIQRAMRTQRALADKYLAEADTVGGNSPRMCQLLKLWIMHDTNAKCWESQLKQL